MMYNISLLVGLKNNLDHSKHFYETTRELYPEVEICFVSYGSVDGTNEWLSSLQDTNVKYFYSEESKTLSDTFNKAAELATNEYVAYVHNDIVLAPGFIENIEKHMSPNNIVSYTTIEPPIFSGHARPGKLICDLGVDLKTFNIQKLYDFVSQENYKYLNKIEPGITFFMCMARKKLLEIGGLDNLFNPMFCEDDDLIQRWKLLGMNCFTALDAMCYHFVSKTSRFSEEYQTKTAMIEFHSNRNFIRKWGSRTNKHKYNIHAVIHNCNYQILELLEPWFAGIYCKCTDTFNWELYCNQEQKNTKFNLRDRIKNIDDLNMDVIDILVEFDAKQLTANSMNIIQNLSDILTESGEIGEFVLDCFKITITNLRTYEHQLIKL